MGRPGTDANAYKIQAKHSEKSSAIIYRLEKRKVDNIRAIFLLKFGSLASYLHSPSFYIIYYINNNPEIVFQEIQRTFNIQEN